MRKKFAYGIFLLVISIQMLMAINQEGNYEGHYKDEFEISAYKIGENNSEQEFFRLYVVDSIYDSFMDPSSTANKIILDNKVNYLFDDLKNNPQPRTTTFNADTMIFHVIAMGNRTGNYSLSLSFSQLKKENPNDVINTAYTMGNARINFENSENSITYGNDTYYVSSPIVFENEYGSKQDKRNFIKDGPISPSVNFTGVIGDSSGSNLKLDWAIASESSIEETERDYWFWKEYKYSLRNIASPMWIARTAVAMSIDKEDFDLSPEGKYTAEVTVRFTSNS